ncbi:unnamed protein product [Owenia fusiformis]|uniref:Sulfotransferase domain-containing protein n=1 Tax=Owenia fusiformis TaxID=6347 RepID=A0A8S4PH64_OWEFU|nr:unnamed protein product [Owenia fusiformis]
MISRKLLGRITLFTLCLTFGHYILLGIENTLIKGHISGTDQISRLMYGHPPMKSPGCSDQKFVLIFSYERSGSTFLGAAMDQHPSIFYIYEPLNPQHEEEMQFPRRNTISDKWLELEADVYRQVQLCKLDQLPEKIDIMRSELLYKFSKVHPDVYMEGFTECMTRKSSRLNPLGINKTDFCIQGVLGLCKSRSVVLVKEVRGTMEGFSRFVQRQDCSDSVKVIHLLRDPRGEINSRFKTKWTHFIKYPLVDKYEFISSLCGRMLKDIRIRRELEKKYPDMFMQLKYEDVTKNPVQTFEALMEFIGLPFFPYHKKMLELKSKNSSVDIWKNTLNRTLLREIDERCSDVYGELGYQKSEVNRI